MQKKEIWYTIACVDDYAKKGKNSMAQICEAIMIIAFGVSWPVNVYKSIRTKSTKGKSLLFLLLIEFGYVSGIVGKIISHNIT